MPLNAAAAAAPSFPARPFSLGTLAPGGVCRPALAAAEARYGIPTGVLQAIGVVESGRRDPVTGMRQPWPWAINAEGVAHVFDTKEQAVAWVRQAQSGGMRSIDIGCAQVNLKHHPDAFTSLEQAFDPAANADYAARFLKELRATAAGGDWMTAVGFYHSQTPDLAEGYRQQVQAVISGGGAANPLVAAFASAPAPMSPFASGAPGQGHASARPATGLLLPAPTGTAGHNLDAYRAMPIQMVAAIRPFPTTLRR